jgi:hypothetical protein
MTRRIGEITALISSGNGRLVWRLRRKGAGLKNGEVIFWLPGRSKHRTCHMSQTDLASRESP